MELLNHILFGFSRSFELSALLSCFIGVFVGTLIGVLPGVGPTATITMLLPFSIKMDATNALIMMAGIYYGAMYGGSTTSILVNIPGEAASVVTCLDGYQMARQGRAGPALGMAAFGSFAAGTMGVLGLMLLAPALASVALQFGPAEIFAVLVLGFTMITYLSHKSKLKGVAMALVGLMLATVGLDPLTSQPRFAFGSMTLMNGIGLVPLGIGLFGISEVLTNIEEVMNREIFQTQIKGLFPNLQDWKRSALPITRAGILGFFLGILPGMGSIIPPLIAYGVEKRVSKHPEKFGTGLIEGVAAPEAANNSAVAGTMIPLLTLGIPPNVVMAVLMGVFLTHGVLPGPLLVKEHPEIFWGVITSMYTGNLMLLVLNLPLIGIWVKLLKVPYDLLFSLIFIFCIIGVYSEAGNVRDIAVMLVFGVVGYVMSKVEYEAAPLILGFVLGRMFEESLCQSVVSSRGDITIFLRHPISRYILIVAFILVIFPLVQALMKKMRQSKSAWNGGE